MSFCELPRFIYTKIVFNCPVIRIEKKLRSRKRIYTNTLYICVDYLGQLLFNYHKQYIYIISYYDVYYNKIFLYKALKYKEKFPFVT